MQTGETVTVSEKPDKTECENTRRVYTKTPRALRPD